MNRKLLRNIFYYLTLVIIVLFSFFHHSSLYSPFLNSDDAVVALMIHDFNLPQDLYYWEANRFGSLIPMAGQFFYKILHFSPIQSESFTQYLLLIAGFLGFASLFKSNIIKLIFAVVWFLPPVRMIDILKVNQGEQYLLIGISVFFISKLYLNPIEKYRFKKHILLILITITFIASLWVSDLAFATIGIIVIYNAVLYVKHLKVNIYSTILKRSELYYIIFGFIAAALFIYYAKTNAIRVENYYSFFDPKIIIVSLNIFLGTIRDLFLFKIREPFTSLYTYLLLFAILFILLNHKRIKLSKNNSRWMAIFSLDLILVFILLISSKWVNLNGVARRYFVCNYISFWIVFLIAADNLKEIKFKRFLIVFIVITVLLGGLGTIYNYKYISPGRLRPTIKIAGEFKSLGKIGIISEYWNSYINSAPDPDKIKATPNDRSMVRKQSLVDSVFSQPQLYVIRDMWMDFFPDTLEQFGYVLLKDGSEFRLGNCQVCKYKKIKLNKTFDLEKLKYNVSQVIIDNELNKKVLYVSSSCDLCKEKYIVFGPYIPLGIGNFKVQYNIKTVPKNDDIFALLDVTAEWGQNQLAAKKISKNDFISVGKYEYIELEFETTKRYSNIEFRILYYGNADLYFDHVKLIEK
jgi:hypothetical protein